MARYWLFNDDQPSDKPIGSYDTLTDTYDAGYGAPNFLNRFHVSIRLPNGEYHTIAHRDAIWSTIEGVGGVLLSGWRMNDNVFMCIDEGY